MNSFIVTKLKHTIYDILLFCVLQRILVHIKIHIHYEKGGKKSPEKELLFHFYDGYIFQIMKLAAKREVLLRHLPL